MVLPPCLPASPLASPPQAPAAGPFPPGTKAAASQDSPEPGHALLSESVQWSHEGTWLFPWGLLSYPAAAWVLGLVPRRAWGLLQAPMVPPGVSPPLGAAAGSRGQLAPDSGEGFPSTRRRRCS